MPNPFIGVVNSLLPEPHASLLNGILFGTRASMQKEFYQALITTGLLHIIALSGMNISIMTALVAQSTVSLGRKFSIVLTIGLIISFVLFVGPSPSIVRAAIMGSLSLLAIYFGRQNWGLLSLFLASGIMLLYNFSLIQNISFQLSFLATLGIILANRKADCQNKPGMLNQFKSLFINNLQITLSAQIFTLPIILYNFHRVSLIAPVANILTEWVIQPLMVLGFLISIIGWIWQPFGYPLAWIAWVPLTYFITVVDTLSKIPGASMRF